MLQILSAEGMSKILFTCDIDWAPEAVIVDTLELFKKFNMKCTLFATHPSKTLFQSDGALFELGIHPNFNPLFEGQSKKTAEDIVRDLLRIYPKAKGVRSHTLTQNSKLIDLFARCGLVYDANLFLPYQKISAPFKLWNGLKRVQFNWEDDVHFLYKRSFKESGLDFKSSELNILNFHPVHIFLNTESSKRYEQAQVFYQDPEKLLRCRNTTKTLGARDLLVSLLKFSKKFKYTKTLSEFVSCK